MPTNVRPSPHVPAAAWWAARLRAWLGGFILIAVLAACGRGAHDADLTVQFRSPAVASDAGALDGAVVREVVWLEVVGPDAISAVRFHVDDPERAAEPARVAEARPFDYEFDTTTLDDGAHTLTIEADAPARRPSVVTTSFVVDNGVAEDGSGGMPRDDDAGGTTEGSANGGDDATGEAADAPTDEGTPAGGATDGDATDEDASDADATGDAATGEDAIPAAPDDGAAPTDDPRGGDDGPTPAPDTVDDDPAGDGSATEGRPSEPDPAPAAEPAPGPAPEPEPDVEPDPEPDPEPEPAPAPTPAPPHGDLPAATLYVAPHGDDGNDGRSADRPLRSVRAAATRVGPGDVVYLRGGVYPIGVEFHRDGTRDAPIVWASYPGERAIFDGAGETPIHSVRKFHVRSDWNVYLDLEIRNAPQEGIYVEDADHNVFRRIVTHGNQYSGIGNVRSDGNVFEDIVTYDNFDDASGHSGGDADGISISSGDGNVIRRVLAFDNSDDGIDVWRSTDTLIEHVAVYRNGRGASGDGNGIKAGAEGVHNGTRVRYVVAFENRRNGFSENRGRDVLFEHSTGFRNGDWDFMGGDGTTRRDNLAPADRSGMWGSHDERNSWNLGVTPSFVSESFGSDGFLVPRAGSGVEGAGTDGSHLGAIPPGGSLRDLVGGTVMGLLPYH